jgi:hypothetical protein
MLIQPLPPVGVHYKTAWGDSYDYYGNLVEQNSKRCVGGSYNESLDAVYNEWTELIYYRFFRNHKHTMAFGDKRFKESEISNVEEVVTRLYGGFGFDSLMRMIGSDPKLLHDSLDHERRLWADKLYIEFFDKFCAENSIRPDQIPSNSMESMRDVFYRHALDGDIVTRDWSRKYMSYIIGVETSNGEIYEMTGEQMMFGWICGHATRNLAGLVVGLQHGINAMNMGRKPGFFEKLFFKRRIEQRKRAMGWNFYVYPSSAKGDKHDIRVNIYDVVRFYPPPPGEPVRNPLL